MAYDAARGVTVLFGGRDAGGFSGETWEWDGTAWTLRSTGGPSARDRHAMAHDAARGVTVLFGGIDAGGFSGETWEWNGTTWALRATRGPSPTGGHAMAYDSARGVTVFFGAANRETWEWDGNAWQLRANGGPLGGGGAIAMTYDSGRGVTVLFNGWERRTWEWEGTAWMLRASGIPSVDDGHAMAYDTRRGVTVLFAGSEGVNILLADTWEWPTVAGVLQIHVHPAGQNTGVGEAVSFTVGASGVAPLTFQWRKDAVNLSDGPTGNGSVISGSTTPTLTIDNAQFADAGNYDVVVTDACSTVTSNPAALTVTCAPCPGDVDGDGDVDLADLGILLANFGRTCP
jgi:hypothetical protein